MTPESEELSADDQKLVTLARAARARIQALAGAAVRDETGRTYVGADVNLECLRISAAELAVAQAVAAGATSVAAIAIVGILNGDWQTQVQPVRELSGTGVTVVLAGRTGSVEMVATT